MGEHRIQKGVQHGGVPQHAGAFALGGHGAGGAAEVQVHFGVTQGTQLTDHPGGQLAVLGQQLRDHRRTGVCGGDKFRHLLFDEHPVLRRGKEGCVVAVGGAFRPEPLLLGLTPDPVGKPLHGGGIILHKKLPVSVPCGSVEGAEALADGGVRCCVIRQLDILKLFLMQVVRTDAYAPIRHRGSVVTWQDIVSCHCCLL